MGFMAINNKNFFWFCVIFVCVVISMLIYINPSLKISAILSKPSPSPLFANGSVSETNASTLSTGKGFDKMIEDYNKHLRQLEKPVYQDNRHVQYGPPITSEIKSGLDTNVKRILLWTEFFGIKQWAPQVMCPGQNKTCITSIDKNDLLKSQGLLIHARDISYLPKDRLPSQRWIYFIQESPYATGIINIGRYNSVFNWTATYRLDSDFPAIYYQSSPLKKTLSDMEYHQQFTKIMTSKKKLAMAAISNCDQSHSNRIKFIYELKKHMKVDFYGSCGEIECAKSNNNCTEFFTQYKFFMSFENANCRDYITEKVLHPLHVFNSVPIVMGGAHPDDYVRIIPPNSFIHYQGFASAKALAEFLMYLDQNDDAYEHYHRWRQTHGKPVEDIWCGMCQGLHNTSMPASVYTDFEGWYAQDTCPGNSILSTPIVSLALIVFVMFGLIALRYARLV